MKAVMLTGAGGTDVLKVMEVPDPVIKAPKDVLVRLHAAGLNPVDYKLRRKGGFYPNRLPLILGCDGAGVVEAVGTEVTKFNVGDEVFFFNGGMGGDDQGNYAEYTTVHQDYLAAKPESVSMVEAASVPLVWLTAWEALFDRYSLAAGETVLIHGGAGGVGYIAVQIAKQAGARVFTTISSQEKATFTEACGADYCINYKKEDFVEAALRLTDGKGVDVVFDVVGGQLFADSFPATRIYGHVVTLDEINFSKEEAGAAKLRNLSLSYELMLTPMHFKMHEARVRQTGMLNEAARMIDAGQIKPHVTNVFSLEEIDKAHNVVEDGHSIGKTVIKIV
ncbi:MAG: zinc-dependent alcohol dehydrogenase family protein [Chloroflexota bacterium]|nr:MAG: zinc-dependent alcohol dehydrogenase family protein [Chloroflexota bacterium]